MNTFDLILFHDSPRRFNPFTPNTWDHVGLVLKDPTWLHSSLRGTFIWETCDTGIQMTPVDDRLSNYSGRVYIRKASLDNAEPLELLQDVSTRLDKNSHNVLTSFLEIKDPDVTIWSAAFIMYVLVRTEFVNYHGLRNVYMTPNEFVPNKTLDKHLLPGLNYSEKLVKLR